ncbi:hypothetical protein ISCGN_010451 [Ixodes scapularis]
MTLCQTGAVGGLECVFGDSEPERPSPQQSGLSSRDLRPSARTGVTSQLGAIAAVPTEVLSRLTGDIERVSGPAEGRETSELPMKAPDNSARRSKGGTRRHRKSDGSEKSKTERSDLTSLLPGPVASPTTQSRSGAPSADLRQTPSVSCLLLFVIGVLVLPLAIILLLPRSGQERVCVTKACTVYSKILSKSISAAVDPCDDFHSYVCDGWTRYDRRSVMMDIYQRFIKTVTLMAKRRTVPRKGQTSIEKAAGFYQSCLNTSRHALQEAHSLKKSLQVCGLHWPILDATSDLLDILFCTALDFYWPVLLSVTRKDDINFVIEPSPYYERVLERREEMLVAQKYNLYYDTMRGYFMTTSNATTLTYQRLLQLEKMVVRPLRDAYNANDGGTMNDTNLASVAAFTASHIPVSRWQTSITKNYNVTSVTALSFTVRNAHLFRTFFDLTKEVGEPMMAYYLGWSMIQRMSRLLNDANLNELYYLTSKRADQIHNNFCINVLHRIIGLAFYADYMNPIATPAVLADLSDVTRTIRGTFQAALASSWIEAKGGTEVDDSATDPSLVLFQLVKLDTLNTYYSEFPDMTDSLYGNIERVPYSQGNRRSPVNILSFERNGVVRLYNATPEGFVLYPNALEMPLYGVDVPPIIKNAALGFVIALAISTTIFENWTYWNASSKAKLVSRAACFIGENLTTEEIDSSHMDLIIRVAALRVLWRAVNRTDTVDEALVLRGLEHLSERKLFFAAWCFMHCGQKKVTDQCNRPLRQLHAFSEVFSCSAKSSMGAPKECPLF